MKETIEGAARVKAPNSLLLEMNGHRVEADSAEGMKLIFGPADLKIDQGEWVVLAGLNGSGKSTLLRELAGLGMSLDGPRLQRHVSAPYDRKPFPVVLQRPEAALAGSTPWEDVVLTLEYAGVDGKLIKQLAERTLESFRLLELAHTSVDGLSGGQKQLVAIAGAVAAGAPMLLFDEATSMLDADSAALVLTRVRELHDEGRTVIWATQKLDELRRSDRVVAIQAGSIIFDGNAKRFLEKNGDTLSHCEQAGLKLPFIVETAYELRKLGVQAPSGPLAPHELAAVFNVMESVHVEAGDNSSGAESGDENDQTDTVQPQQDDLITENFLPDAAAGSAESGQRLRFRSGAITLLVGSNGSGKSTLLESLAGLRKPAAGSIYYGSMPLWDQQRPVRDTLLQLGVTLQQSESQWFCRTVRQEMNYSLKPYRLGQEDNKRRIADAFQAAGLPEALLEQDPWTLSGGQQRRLALACVLACQPAWLLLDEPTAGLDPDGLERLSAILQAHRADGRSVVAAVHGLEALLPIANEVAIMQGGRIRKTLPAAEYARRLARNGGASAPQRLFAAQLLGAGGTLWHTPKELAARLAGAAASEALSSRAAAAGSKAESRRQNVEKESSLQEDLPEKNGMSREALSPKRVAPVGNAPAATSPVHAPVNEPAQTAFIPAAEKAQPDPRALIGGFALVSAAMMAQQSWTGVLISLLAAVLIILPHRKLIAPYAALVRGYAILTLILAGIAGLRLAPLEFEAEPALTAAFALARLLSIMLLGLPLLALIPPFRMQRAADQLLAPLARLGVPVVRITLAISLLFRFLPMLTMEWQRYARIAAARGKLPARPGKVPPRMMASIAIPFLLSLLRIGDAVADALEARGFGHGAKAKTLAFRLRFSRHDWMLLLAACGLSFLLFVLSRLIP